MNRAKLKNLLAAATILSSALVSPISLCLHLKENQSYVHGLRLQTRSFLPFGKRSAVGEDLSVGGPGVVCDCQM